MIRSPSRARRVATLLPPLLLTACSDGLSTQAQAACAMASAPIASEADRTSLASTARALSPDEVKPNRIGQFYFMLREASLRVPASSPISEAGLATFQKDLEAACEAEGYEP